MYENTSRWCWAGTLALRKSWGPPPSDSMPCPHPSTLCYLFFYFLLYLLFPFQSQYSCSSFSSWFPSLISNSPSHFRFSPHFPPLAQPLTPPSCLSLHHHIFLLIQTGLAVCCPTLRPEPKQRCPPPHSPKPPHSPTGGDRALPSDYTGAMGLEYSPEGRQLSISDNCREKDTHARVCAHTRTPSLTPPCFFVNQGAIT